MDLAELKFFVAEKALKNYSKKKGNDKINAIDENPMNFQLNPAKNKIYIPDIRITKLVPRSG